MVAQSFAEHMHTGTGCAGGRGAGPYDSSYHPTGLIIGTVAPRPRSGPGSLITSACHLTGAPWDGQAAPAWCRLHALYMR